MASNEPCKPKESPDTNKIVHYAIGPRYQAMCGLMIVTEGNCKEWIVTNLEEDVTCPLCLELMGGKL